VVRLLEQLLVRLRWPRQNDRPPKIKDATLVITHAELSYRHGTGALLIRILKDEPNVVALYSQTFFDGHDIDVPAFQVTYRETSIGGASRRIRDILAGSTIKQILCVPFYPDEALSALAAQEITKAPLVLYIMDDQNIHAEGITDQLMKELVNRSSIRFAISEPLRAAYEEKFGQAFYLLPPVVDPHLFAPADLAYQSVSPPVGAMIGNLWSKELVEQFIETVKGSGLSINWYGNAGKPFLQLDPDELAKTGIHLKSLVPEEQLVRELRAADYAVVPGGTLDDKDTHHWLAKASLPSRIIFLLTTANLPIVILGHPETAAARFVTELGIGTVRSYSSDQFRAAVEFVTEPTRNREFRRNARALSPAFSSEGLLQWIEASANRGRPADNRFAKLGPPG
jgi:hypothetical protein